MYGPEEKYKGINENSYRLLRCQHMLKYMYLSSSLREYVASDAKSSVITPSFRFYFHFLLVVNWLKLRCSLASYLAQSLHICLCDIHWLTFIVKTSIFQHCYVTNCPPYRKRTEPWHHCVESNQTVTHYNPYYIYIYIYIYISGGPLSALTCCVNVRLLSPIKKISPLIYSQSWVGSWVYTTQAMMTFTLIF